MLEATKQRSAHLFRNVEEAYSCLVGHIVRVFIITVEFIYQTNMQWCFY